MRVDGSKIPYTNPKERAKLNNLRFDMVFTELENLKTQMKSFDRQLNNHLTDVVKDINRLKSEMKHLIN